MTRLQELGLPIITPGDPARRAGNISFAHTDAEGVAGKLAEQDVYLMGSDGRVRASIHAFTDSADIGRLTELLPSVVGGRA
jgi:selenocysteine lyase/cysteine desulfurase